MRTFHSFLKDSRICAQIAYRMRSFISIHNWRFKGNGMRWRPHDNECVLRTRLAVLNGELERYFQPRPEVWKRGRLIMSTPSAGFGIATLISPGRHLSAGALTGVPGASVLRPMGLCQRVSDLVPI